MIHKNLGHAHVRKMKYNRVEETTHVSSKNYNIQIDKY